MRYANFVVLVFVLATVAFFPSNVDGLFILITAAMFASIYAVRRLGR